MAKLIISQAACTEAVIQKIKVASKMLLAYGIEPKIIDWDGVRTHLLIGSPQDSYGLRVINLALSHNLPILMVTSQREKYSVLVNENDNVEWIEPSKPAAIFEKKLESLLYKSDHRVISTKFGQNINHINKLQKTKTAMVISSDTYSIIVDKERGICCSDTESHMRGIALAFRANSKLTVKPIKEYSKDYAFFNSIEQFFFSTLISIHTIPTFEGKAAQLRNWPNINHSQYSEAIARLSNIMISGPVNIQTLSKQAPPTVVNALLYATSISGMLETKKTKVEKNAKIKSGLLNKETRGRSKLLSGLFDWLGMQS